MNGTWKDILVVDDFLFGSLKAAKFLIVIELREFVDGGPDDAEMTPTKKKKN